MDKVPAGRAARAAPSTPTQQRAPLDDYAGRSTKSVCCCGVSVWLALAPVLCHASERPDWWSQTHPVISSTEAVALARAVAKRKGYPISQYGAPSLRHGEDGIWIITFHPLSGTAGPTLGAIVGDETGDVWLLPRN